MAVLKKKFVINRVSDGDNPPVISDSQQSASFHAKIENIEQKLLNNTLLFQGTRIQNIISTNNSYESMCSTLLHELSNIVTDYDSASLISSIKLFGSDKKSIRIVARDNESKNKLLTSIKRKRPNNLYANEFLVPERRKLFYEARRLSKSSHLIVSAFTRDGVVYC